MHDYIPRLARHTTLIGATLLHAFTHAYGALLVPLYLLMVDDLKLDGIRSASGIVTIYMIVYCLGSYGGGMLADRWNRKWLLGIGLIGNAAAITAIGLVRQPALIVMLAVVGGLFGTLFHPSANALVPAHYPKNAGLAIGLLGIGSGVGFFVGPQFAGWRASAATWNFASVANWQKPLVELGLAGIACGVAFLVFAKENRDLSTGLTKGRQDDSMRSPTAIGPGRVMAEDLSFEYEPQSRLHLSRKLRRQVGWLSLVLGCRDFAAVASLTLSSLFLQKALGYSVRDAGFALGTMMLMGIIANPLAVVISPGRKRLPMLSGVLAIGGLIVATTPFWPAGWVVAMLALFQMCQLGSYAMSDAAMMERVHPDLRGRVVGLFLTLAGTGAALSPLVMGSWVDALGEAANRPESFVLLYGFVGLMMIVSAFSWPLIAALEHGRSPQQATTGRNLDERQT